MNVEEAIKIMSNLNELKAILETDLAKAKEQRKKIIKQIRASATHESRGDFAEGLVAGIECAIVIVDAQILKVKENIG